MNLVTWNVLHRIHAEKWSRHVIAQFPSERARIERIAARVAGWLAEGADAVTLQEVSGDQLAALRRLGATVLSHRYPRVPTWLRFWSKPLDDRSEHLVTVLAREGRSVEALTFDSDDGKGLLAVETRELRLVNTHLSFGKHGTAQLRHVGEALRRAPRGVLAGDFNTEREHLAAALGEGIELANVGPTCAPSRRHGLGRAIDHVAVYGGGLERVEVLGSDGLSDHHPVRASVSLLRHS